MLALLKLSRERPRSINPVAMNFSFYIALTAPISKLTNVVVKNLVNNNEIPDVVGAAITVLWFQQSQMAHGLLTLSGYWRG